MNNLSLQSLRNSSEVLKMYNEVDQFSAQRLKKVLKEKGKNVTRAAFDYILETKNKWKDLNSKLSITYTRYLLQ